MSTPLTLGYAGSVAYGYGEELVKLIPVLREVGARIRMFSPKPSRSLDALNQASDVVEICGYRPAMEAWREIQETCDAVILPYMNPAEGNESLYRTHFPSKLTEYLALGMPVIVSGPEFATGVRYARGAEAVAPQKIEERRSEMGEESSRLENEDRSSEEARAALFQLPTSRLFLDRSPNGAVPCTSREELVCCLQRLRSDAELRMELAKRASEAGRRDFDPFVIRRHFVSALVEAYNAR